MSEAITRSSRSIRRAADSLGNRVVGYVGGIDMNRNRLDTPGHHGRSLAPARSGVECAVAAGFSRRACPDHRPRRRRRRADVRPAVGLRLQPSAAPAAGLATAARSGVPDTGPRRPGRGATAAGPPPGPGGPQRLHPRPGRRQHAAAVVAGRRGDHSRSDASRRSSGARIHLHRGPVLHPAGLLHPRAAGGLGARTPAAAADRDPDRLGSALRRHPAAGDVRAAARRSRRPVAAGATG